MSSKLSNPMVKEQPDLRDWVYLYNFSKKDNPIAISLAPGDGENLKKSMASAIEELQQEIKHSLQSEDYENTVNGYLSSNTEKQARSFSDLEKIAKKMDFQIKSTSLGIETIPFVEGRPLSEKEYNKLDDSARKAIESRRSKLEPKVLDFARKVRNLEREAKEYVEQLQKNIVGKVIDRSLEDLMAEFSGNELIVSYLTDVKLHIK